MSKYSVFYGFRVSFTSIKAASKEIDKLYDEVVPKEVVENNFFLKEATENIERLRLKLDDITAHFRNVSALTRGFYAVDMDLNDGCFCIPILEYYKNFDKEEEAIRERNEILYVIDNIPYCMQEPWERAVSTALEIINPSWKEIPAMSHIIDFGDLNELHD